MTAAAPTAGGGSAAPRPAAPKARRGILQRLAKPLAWTAVIVAGLISLGGGATAVALKVTTDSKFCNTCHNMEPYVQSWKTSSHHFVPCVDCHYEPGILETINGKVQALSQLAKYVTQTQGTKPWAEVSDYSCMRSGCHSERLLEGEIQFGRIRFDHRDHLFGERRGMKLRCTSCHSQIVQGDHLTVTPTTCILCHFKESAKDAKKATATVSSCEHCHGPPTTAKDLGGGLSFRHSEYLARGVKCESCHGDVTRGKGEVPRQRCGQCHNKKEHLERYDDLEFVHRHHVTEHSVACSNCHVEMQHGLPKKEDHAKGQCTDCHSSTHETTTSLVRGTGGRNVPDLPSPMYQARVTCKGCHRPPFPDAPTPQGGGTFKADLLACLDCHGAGFEGMAERWQAEVRAASKQVSDRVAALKQALDASKGADATRLAAARKSYEDAAYNLNIVLLDRSDGAHNLEYARSLLAKAAEDAAAGLKALDPAAAPAAISIGPKVAAKGNCTTLCHLGIEEKKVEHGLGFPFDHTAHITKGALDCATCHDAKPQGSVKPHAVVKIKASDCASCHHPKASDGDACAKCHTEQKAFLAHEVEGTKSPPMQDVDCMVCHAEIGKGHKRSDIKAACIDCHKTDQPGTPGMKESEGLDEWIASFLKPVDDLLAKVDALPPEKAGDLRKQLSALRRAGPWHNVAFTKSEMKRLEEAVAAAGK